MLRDDTLTVELAAPANDMVQEEIVKQIAHISRGRSGCSGFATTSAPSICEFTGDPDSDAESVRGDIERVARQDPALACGSSTASWCIGHRRDGIGPATRWSMSRHLELGRGAGAAPGAVADAVRGLTRLLDEYIGAWHPMPIQTPTLIPAPVLARCDYFRSFPQYVSFVSHLHEEFTTIDAFRTRHQERDTLDDGTRTDLDIPDVCLSPAVCYHIYHRHAGHGAARRGHRLRRGRALLPV